MAKSAAQIEQEFLRDLKAKTGQDLRSWLKVLKESGLTKHHELIKFMKDQHGWRHLESSMLSAIYRNGGQPVYASDDDLLTQQLGKYPEWEPVFHDIAGKILKTVPGATMIPKKTYVSFARKREFAAVNIKKSEIRLGMDLGDRHEDGLVQRAKLTGPMPRISRMVVIRSSADWNDQIESLLREADARVNE
ncbi:MAG: DUF5655 domain-containing protein [Saprospiraceae bacterium]|nr:DUF5655 domain-containing protein [Saprospiraceae bacterium]